MCNLKYNCRVPPALDPLVCSRKNGNGSPHPPTFHFRTSLVGSRDTVHGFISVPLIGLVGTLENVHESFSLVYSCMLGFMTARLFQSSAGGLPSSLTPSAPPCLSSRTAWSAGLSTPSCPICRAVPFRQKDFTLAAAQFTQPYRSIR